MDDESFAWLHRLRRQHFPPKRNFLPAHLTLFHRLSAAQVDQLRFLEIPRSAVAMQFDRIAFLGSGVALHVESAELERLRNQARTAFGGHFTRQDSQTWKPHVTIQNKVSAENAQRLHALLQRQLSECAGAATGLFIWEYLGGPWKLESRTAFS